MAGLCLLIDELELDNSLFPNRGDFMYAPTELGSLLAGAGLVIPRYR